ncbi:hypothetical protein WME79_47385 [Sorangium sp. So ce726]|uniref:hypothetical protein n=1 Tax=Sorangium sp. So ce726 TaxID=3133319 RepID=UPI003F600505
MSAPSFGPPMRAAASVVRALSSAALATVALLASGCLDLSQPQHEPPPQTAPYLIASAASPSQLQVVYIHEEDVFLDFGAAVLSEDNSVDVEIALYLDYGTRNSAGQPYRDRDYPFEAIEAGTMHEGQRPFVRRWFLGSSSVTAGCHTLTMVASHAFDVNVCPADLKDMSYLTWQLIKCDPDDPSCPTSCPELACAASKCPSCADFNPGGEAR